jgi:NAD(P)-dependent dehydrogenase (short-subunit alcohol dehydrogenase family)
MGESMEAGRLDGRVLLITGAARGLGEATARLALERGAVGLLLVDKDSVAGAATAAALDRPECRVAFVAADLGDAAACGQVIDTLDRTFGVVHGVVNAAAVTDRGSVWDTTPELWDQMLDVNVRAPFLLMQGAARIMLRQGVAGSMVTIGSMTGHGGQTWLLPYAVSKGALLVLTRNLANSLMRYAIRVNQLNLGWMDTPTEDAIQKRYHGAGDDWREEAAAALPWGRLITPAEVARVLCFLLSGESGMMSGVAIDYEQRVLGADEAVFPAPGAIPDFSGLRPPIDGAGPP